jgi:trimethylamine--corrinoid protein Co-methyltransferase
MTNSQTNTTYHRGLDLENQARFKEAKAVYSDLLPHVTDPSLLEKLGFRMADMDDLIQEKNLYQRIDQEAKQVLTDIGIDLTHSPDLMDLLMAADAVDLENETALFIPLRKDYIDHCLSLVPRQMTADPGLNTFGTGSTSPFLKRSTDDRLCPASRQEYEKIIAEVGDARDVTGIFSLPVAFDKSVSFVEIAQMMEKGYPGFKMIPTNTMDDDALAFLKGKPDWLDGTSLIASLAPMDNMVAPFLRSARAGNNLLLIDQTIAGVSGPATPQALLTQVHAQVLFMMIVAQTLTPGTVCVHCGIPSVTNAGGQLSYSSPHQTFINAALARLNTWVTGFASSQTGGSTSLDQVNDQAIKDSELSRNALRKYGVHILRHAMGALGSLTFFSLEKFLLDCERERQAVDVFNALPKDKGVIPLYVPEDANALDGIREIAEKGNPRHADHSLRHVDAFRLWETTIHGAAKEKSYYPSLNDVVMDAVKNPA